MPRTWEFFFAFILRMWSFSYIRGMLTKDEDIDAADKQHDRELRVETAFAAAQTCPSGGTP